MLLWSWFYSPFQVLRQNIKGPSINLILNQAFSLSWHTRKDLNVSWCDLLLTLGFIAPVSGLMCSHGIFQRCPLFLKILRSFIFRQSSYGGKNAYNAFHLSIYFLSMVYFCRTKFLVFLWLRYDLQYAVFNLAK